jgi:dCMP deaminase
MDRELKWDIRFLRIAREVASWSKDPSAGVGAVIVNPSTNNIISTGFNGFPRGVNDTTERYNKRELKYQFVVHAEENAIIAAGNRANGGVLYVWPSFMLPPICARCCASAIQAGIIQIVGIEVDESKLEERQLRWKDSILLAREMCNEAGINYRGVKSNG